MNRTLAILDEIAAIGSTKAKEAIILREKDNAVLKAVFVAAYDTTINYHIRKIPEYQAGKCIPQLTLTEALAALGDLSSRKVTGTAAINSLGWILTNCSSDDATVIERVVKRDLRCNCSDSIASRVWPKLVPEFPYMRCSLMKGAKTGTWDWKSGVYSQLKADAMFANVDYETDGEIFVTSRNGSEFPIDQFETLCEDVRKLIPVGYRLNGELQVERDGKILPREIGNGILNSVLKGGMFAYNEHAVYDVWDIIPLEQASPNGRWKGVPYTERFKALQSYLNADTSSIRIIPTKIVHSIEEAYEHYFELVALGFEGTIIKDGGGEWFDGTSKFQVKLKVECDIDVKIVGFTQGNGKNESLFGAVSVESSDGLVKADVSGFTDSLRVWIHEHREELLDTIMTVKFNNITQPNKHGVRSLFLPRCVELRTDKNEADSFERIVEQFEAALGKK